MVISKKKIDSIEDFENLITETVNKLKNDANSSEQRMKYYLGRNAQKLEDDVVEVMQQCAIGTVFEGSIEKISGQSFPDIIANDFFGLEVKTTKKDSWKSTGSSVLESTRVDNIERIYMLFGKLYDPVDFKFKKYEDCLSDVAITHAPRYLIDMNLQEGETIFDKIKTSYDDIRNEDNPAVKLLSHYKNTHGDESSNWWIDLFDDSKEEDVAPLKIRHWSSVSKEEKKHLIIKAYIYFPEIIESHSKKYTRLAIWLIKKHSIINPSLRDSFTAGGKVQIKLNGNDYTIPKKIHNLSLMIDEIMTEIENTDTKILEHYWGVRVNKKEKLKFWKDYVIEYGTKTLNKYGCNLTFKDIFGFD